MRGRCALPVSIMTKHQDYTPSEGEEFMENFFLSLDIDFQTQKKIYNLKNDLKQFRTADFYLPRYKVYVEFFGLWNNTGNDEYKQKKEVYRQNRIPCVYIYPENLGIIHFTFDKRLQSVLKTHSLKRELSKYRLYKLKNSRQLRDYIFQSLVFLFLLYIVLQDTKYTIREYIGFAFMFIIIIAQIYRFVQLYLDIFSRNKFPLTKLY